MVILIVAAALRFHAVTRDTRLYPDEALFATFARNAAVKGEWLLPGALDKPPLTIYASALSMTLVGVTSLPDGTLTLDTRTGEFTARLPNLFASLMLAAVMFALAKRLYRHGAGTRYIVSLLIALSPFAITFSATALTDGLMLLFLALALWRMSASRPLWAGVWLALAFACKQQALLYVPLLMLVGWGRSLRTRSILSLLPPMAGIVLLLAAWDMARSPPGSLWVLAAANNDPGRLIRADEVLPRLLTWAHHALNFVGCGWTTAVLGGLALLALAARIVRHPRHPSTLTDVLLAAYLFGYGLLHGLVAFNTYDRYLLPVLPAALLLIGRGLTWVLDMVGTRSIVARRVCVMVIGLCIFMPAFDAANDRWPGGGSKYAGIDQLAAHLNAKPLGTIIYDHWLGWELDYYLGAWTDKRRVYYPTPSALAAGALAQPDPAARYFVALSAQPLVPWLDALRAAGFVLSVDVDDGRYIVYRLIHPQTGAGV